MNDKMQKMQKLLRNIALVGQVGAAAVTPPLVLIYLAWRLISRRGWGVWVMIAAIVFGMVCSVCSVWQLLKRFHPDRKDDRPTGFNDHR